MHRQLGQTEICEQCHHHAAVCDYRRAVGPGLYQTVDYFYESLAHALRECLVALAERRLNALLAGEQGVEPPFGESNEAFAKRVCEGFIKIIDGLIKTGTDRAAIVTHGGVMMALLTNFGLPQLPMHEWITPNGCGYTLRITPSLWMRGHKLEVVYEFPYEKNDEDGEEE